jgi:hypothetical protein
MILGKRSGEGKIAGMRIMKGAYGRIGREKNGGYCTKAYVVVAVVQAHDWARSSPVQY